MKWAFGEISSWGREEAGNKLGVRPIPIGNHLVSDYSGLQQRAAGSALDRFQPLGRNLLFL